MEFYNNYINNISKTPSESYKEIVQESINAQWDNTTQLRKIKEQSYPFSDEYTEYEALVDSVSDVSVNTSKVIGDYINILFKDISHPLNVRGQKYLYDTKNNGSEQVYLCYDKINPLGQVANLKAIRCNNFIKWKDKTNGSIKKEPIFLGYEITATNNNITKDGIISQRRLVVLIQGNEDTKKIRENQRFMISHSKVFKVTEINNMIMDDINTGDSTLLTMYIEWDSLLDKDSTALNICDYYDDIYSINIDQNDIEQIKGHKGKLTYTSKLDDEIIDNVPIIWKSSNSNIVTINEKGYYELVGEIGDNCTIKCTMKENEEVFDEITVSIVSDCVGKKVIHVTPNIKELKENSSVNFVCGVYLDSVKQTDVIKCEPNWIGDNYTLEETIDGYKLTNNLINVEPLILTFSSGDCEPVVMEIKLKGLF